jgi:hypothetical protein
VFFDLFEKDKMWGVRLYVFWAEVYEKKARYCIFLLSSAYRDRIWTRHELQAAFGRAVHERREYILPVRLDDTEIAGIPPELAYLSLKDTPVEGIADLLVRKIARDKRESSASGLQTDSVVAVFRDRQSALTNLDGHLQNEESQVCIVGTTLKGLFMDQGGPFLRTLTAKSRHGMSVRMMLAHEDLIEGRAIQEMRAPGALRNELRMGPDLAHRTVPKAMIRLLRIHPAYFAVQLSEIIAVNPYPYTHQAFHSPTFVFRRTDADYDVYSIHSRDIANLRSRFGCATVSVISLYCTTINHLFTSAYKRQPRTENPCVAGSGSMIVWRPW